MAREEPFDHFRLGQAVVDELEKARTVEEALGQIDSVEEKRGPQALRAALLTLLADSAASRAAGEGNATPLGEAYDAFLVERAKAAMMADLPESIPEEREGQP